MKVPTIATLAAERWRREGDAGIRWVWNFSDPCDRLDVDRYLVAIAHPAAFEPGTTYDRFRTLARELAETNA